MDQRSPAAANMRNSKEEFYSSGDENYGQLSEMDNNESEKLLETLDTSPSTGRRDQPWLQSIKRIMFPLNIFMLVLNIVVVSVMAGKLGVRTNHAKVPGNFIPGHIVSPCELFLRCFGADLCVFEVTRTALSRGSRASS